MSETETYPAETRKPVFCMTLAEAKEAAEKGFRPYHWSGPDPSPVTMVEEEDEE